MAVWQIVDKGFLEGGQLYLLVDVWYGDTATGPADVREDFIIGNMPRIKRTVVTDASGNWLLLDGTPVAPNQARTMNRDLFQHTETKLPIRDAVQRTVNRFIQRAVASGYQGDKSLGASTAFSIGGTPQRTQGPGAPTLDRVDRDNMLRDAG